MSDVSHLPIIDLSTASDGMTRPLQKLLGLLTLSVVKTVFLHDGSDCSSSIRGGWRGSANKCQGYPGMAAQRVHQQMGEYFSVPSADGCPGIRTPWSNEFGPMIEDGVRCAET